MNENFYFLPMFSTLQHANCGETTSSQFIFREFTSHFCSKKSSAFHAFSFVGKRKKISVEFIRASVSCGDQNGPKFFAVTFKSVELCKQWGAETEMLFCILASYFYFFDLGRNIIKTHENEGFPISLWLLHNIPTFFCKLA